MVFSSAIFILSFLPIVFIVNYLVKPEYSNLFLFVASLIFYAWGEPFLVLVMFVSIVINWLIGRTINCTKGKIRKATFIFGISCNICLLGYYKYVPFFVESINGLLGIEVLPVPYIVLPIGISFFTFQAISYIADVYKGETEAASKFVNTALYISFFPQLIAGPIVKYREINKKIENRVITFEGVSDGFKRFIYGLAKKVLLSNVLGQCVDTIYAYDLSFVDGKMVWIGSLAYTLQIYYDFSGYSDMAIGLGKMFGFDIPENFNYPYLSKSISEFWRRWHISLGSWFREYVYIPLGGSKKGKKRTYFNLGVVFLLTGLWHGADLSFVLWGCYHGFFVILERLVLKKFINKSNVISSIYCFLVVNFGWVLFRTENTQRALNYLSRMVFPWKYHELGISAWTYLDKKTIFVGLCSILGIGIIQKIPESVAKKWKGSWIEAIYCVILFILCLAGIVSNSYNPFIYFQF